MDSRNEAVLIYLEVERVAPPGTNGPWVIDGYSLATHPDLCDRVKEVNEAAGEPATLRYLYGKPALVAANGVNEAQWITGQVIDSEGGFRRWG